MGSKVDLIFFVSVFFLFYLYLFYSFWRDSIYTYPKLMIDTPLAFVASSNYRDENSKYQYCNCRIIEVLRFFVLYNFLLCICSFMLSNYFP